MEQVVLVDNNDQDLDIIGKMEAHAGKGLLHRAISVWIVNSVGKTLVTKRSEKKLLWPLYWSNSVCSHPKPGESYKSAGERRVQEELGLGCRLDVLFAMKYEAEYKDVGWEREMVGVLVGVYDGEIYPDSDEIADYRWVDWKSLKTWSNKERENFTPWFFLEKEKLEETRSFREKVHLQVLSR